MASPVLTNKKSRELNPNTFLATIGGGRMVSFFMNRFRKLGFVDYSGGPEGGLQVHSSLLSVVLHD